MNERSKEPCLVLLSGGLDSAVTAAWAKNQGYSIQSIAFAYGQRHDIELKLGSRQAEIQGSTDHRIVELPVGSFGGSALTDRSRTVPHNVETTATGVPKIPTTYVPVRNLVFLSVAGALAEAQGILNLAIGVNAVDYSGYPDCRPPFVAAMTEVLNQASKRVAEEGEPYRLLTPLLDMKKEEIIQLGLELGVDFEQTSSCYDPDPQGCPCRQCDSCRIREEAFGRLSIRDPRLIAFGL